LYQQDTKQIFDLKMSDTTLSGMVKRRASAAQAHWNQLYDLDKVREKNAKLYTTEYIEEVLRDKRYEEVFADNRLFVAVQTILPFITGRITQPEITPANGSDIAMQFGADFERTMVEVAEDEYAKDKVKLAIQDVLRGQRLGVLKWCYDPETGGICLEHIAPDAIIIGKCKLREEPPFIQHTLDMTVGDMIRKFPDKKDEIFRLFDIQKGTASQLEAEHKVTESWMFIDDEKGKRTLAIVWCYQETVLGKMTDPNWAADGQNIIKKPMTPFVFFNLLNDGTGYIDHTSYIEQAQYSQKNYDKRGQTIEENAAYGGIGVPVFGKGAVKAETAAKVRFSPIQRIMLDIEDVNKGFTTWNAQQLPNFIVEDKYDLRNNVDNIFGTPNIFRGEQSKNNTLGQDVIVRDQAEGRQQGLVDCVDNAMKRFYMIEAQLMFRYFDEEQFYNFIGEDGKFEAVIISQERIARNFGIKISVKAGTSMPVDRSQKRATTLKLLEMNKIGTLAAYKALGVEDPEETFKQFIQEQVDPKALLGDVEKDLYDREAVEDLISVIGGNVPSEHDDIKPSYVEYLQNWLLTDRYHQLEQPAQQAVSSFVDGVVQKAQLKIAKMATMQPVPKPNEAAAASVMPPGAPGAPGAPAGGPLPGGVPATPPAPNLAPPMVQ
jgi:hypothetical protein